jgi:hypothetical protein
MSLNPKSWQFALIMNRKTTVALLGAILTVAAIAVATVAIAPMEASVFRLNNQQTKSCSSKNYKSQVTIAAYTFKHNALTNKHILFIAYLAHSQTYTL